MKYYIGMHMSFDEDKYQKDYFDKISGIEFCNFTCQNAIDEVVLRSRKEGFDIGVHFPFNKNTYKYRDPLLMAKESSERALAFEAIEKELSFASQSKAKYLLLHFPKPIVVSNKIDWTMARLMDSEYMYDVDMDYSTFKRLAEDAFIKLDRLSTKYDLPIVLEVELINKWIYETDLLERLLDQYDNISVCLDTARLHVMDMMDSNFNLQAL